MVFKRQLMLHVQVIRPPGPPLPSAALIARLVAVAPKHGLELLLPDA